MTRLALASIVLVAAACGEAPVTPSARDRAAAPAPPLPALVQAVPAELDLGTVFVGAAPTATLRLVNTSGTAVRVGRCTTSCKCTTADCPAGGEIPPGGSVELTVTLDAEYARLLTQRVSVTFDESAPVHVPVSVHVLNYVSVDPPSMDPHGWPDGRFAIRANDGRAFRVLAVSPAVVERVPDEAATEHELIIKWGDWDHVTRLLRIDLDHPLVKRVQVELAPEPRDVPNSDRAA